MEGWWDGLLTDNEGLEECEEKQGHAGEFAGAPPLCDDGPPPSCQPAKTNNT